MWRSRIFDFDIAAHNHYKLFACTLSFKNNNNNNNNCCFILKGAVVGLKPAFSVQCTDDTLIAIVVFVICIYLFLL